MIISENLDIIGITETWIQEKTKDFIGEHEIPGYKLFKKDRLNKKGGGVMIYVRNHLNPIECNLETEYEVVGVNINSLGKNMLVMLTYRPPHQTVDRDNKYRLLGQEVNGKLSVLMGDFIAEVNWDSISSASYAEGILLPEFVEK